VDPIFAQASAVDTKFIHYLPILSTTIAAVFTIAFCRRPATPTLLGVLYVTELVGLLLIWAGLRVISVFSSQRAFAAMSA
jgi:hypothetical protein